MAQIIIDIPLQQAQRVGAALGKELNLVDAEGKPRSATVPEYKAWLIDYTKRMVMGVEHREAVAAMAQPTPPDVT